MVFRTVIDNLEEKRKKKRKKKAKIYSELKAAYNTCHSTNKFIIVNILTRSSNNEDCYFIINQISIEMDAFDVNRSQLHVFDHFTSDLKLMYLRGVT